MDVGGCLYSRETASGLATTNKREYVVTFSIVQVSYMTEIMLNNVDWTVDETANTRLNTVHSGCDWHATDLPFKGTVSDSVHSQLKGGNS